MTKKSLKKSLGVMMLLVCTLALFACNNESTVGSGTGNENGDNVVSHEVRERGNGAGEEMLIFDEDGNMMMLDIDEDGNFIDEDGNIVMLDEDSNLIEETQ